MEAKHERQLLDLFDIGLFFKAAGAAIEIGAAFVIAFVPRVFVERIANIATEGELSGDPNDFIGMHVRGLAHTYAVHAHYILATYLFLDGLLKIALVVLVFRKYRHAFPLFIGGVGILAIYTAYRAVATHQLLLLGIVALDVVLLLLAAHEGKRRYSSLG